MSSVKNKNNYSLVIIFSMFIIISILAYMFAK